MVDELLYDVLRVKIQIFFHDFFLMEIFFFAISMDIHHEFP